MEIKCVFWKDPSGSHRENRLEEAEHIWDSQCRANNDGVVMMVLRVGS